MKISRRNFLNKLTVGVAGLTFVCDSSRAQTKGKLGYMKIVDNAAMFLAMEKGFFKAEGLEIEPVPMAGGAVIVQGVTSGDLQFGWTNVISLYQAVVEGFDFKLIADARPGWFPVRSGGRAFSQRTRYGSCGDPSRRGQSENPHRPHC
jgi:ABC-type nitrate/sulfonate/bicarbonate transport system substrate-binding protein